MPGETRDVRRRRRSSQYAAVRLFIERAVAVRPGFAVTNENAPAVAAICARLHGMPLAIELAAARIKLLSPDAILARLEHQLDVLAAGARDLPARQQTLRGAIAWSYDLLDDGAERLLDRLSVFASGCDLEAAEAICGPAAEIGGDVVDGLMALADQSLVKVDETADGEPRFRLLDTIREYAAEQPRGARRDATLIQARHRDWFVALAAEAAAGAVRRRPAALARPARARARRHPGGARPGRRRSRTRRSRSGSRSRCGASGRSTATSPRRGAARGDGRGAVVARRPAAPGQPAGGARRRLLVAGRDRRRWAAATRRRSSSGRRIGDEAEIANAYYNASFISTRSRADGRRPRRPVDPEDVGMRLPRGGARDLPPDRRPARRGERAVGARQLPLLPTGTRATASTSSGEALEIFREVGDRTMEAWALHMLGIRAAAQRRLAEAREADRARDPPLPRGRRRGRA